MPDLNAPESSSNSRAVERALDESKQVKKTVEEAADELASGDVMEAETGFREALEKEPDNREAALGLAGILVGRGAFPSGAVEMVRFVNH